MKDLWNSFSRLIHDRLMEWVRKSIVPAEPPDGDLLRDSAINALSDHRAWELAKSRLMNPFVFELFSDTQFDTARQLNLPQSLVTLFSEFPHFLAKWSEIEIDCREVTVLKGYRPWDISAEDIAHEYYLVGSTGGEQVHPVQLVISQNTEKVYELSATSKLAECVANDDVYSSKSIFHWIVKQYVDESEDDGEYDDGDFDSGGLGQMDEFTI